jgi:hypothetical protein
LEFGNCWLTPIPRIWINLPALRYRLALEKNSTECPDKGYSAKREANVDLPGHVVYSFAEPLVKAEPAGL